MRFPDEQFLFGYWLVVMVFVLSSAAFFMFTSTSAQTKRKAFKWYCCIGGLLVGGWFVMLGGLPALVFFIPLYAVSVAIAWRTTRFCDACGKTLMNQFIRARFCPRCGADLDAQDAERNTNVGEH